MPCVPALGDANSFDPSGVLNLLTKLSLCSQCTPCIDMHSMICGYFRNHKNIWLKCKIVGIRMISEFQGIQPVIDLARFSSCRGSRLPVRHDLTLAHRGPN
jgi:hypothetical protein